MSSDHHSNGGNSQFGLVILSGGETNEKKYIYLLQISHFLGRLLLFKWRLAPFSSSRCDVSAVIWIMCVDTLLSLFQIWSGGTMEHLEVVAAARRPIRACSVASFHALLICRCYQEVVLTDP